MTYATIPVVIKDAKDKSKLKIRRLCKIQSGKLQMKHFQKH